jgi:hypothetical protein
MVFDLFGYGVELNWRLMWFPIHSTSPLEEVRARANSFRLPRGDVPRPQAPKAQYDLGNGGSDGARLDLNHPIFALIKIGTGPSNYVEADVELTLSTAHTRTTVIVEPGARTPFMLSLHGLPEPEPRGDLGDTTAAVVDGVFNAGPRIKLSDLMQFVRI